jgi:hypothetical protein
MLRGLSHVKPWSSSKPAQAVSCWDADTCTVSVLSITVLPHRISIVNHAPPLVSCQPLQAS